MKIFFPDVCCFDTVKGFLLVFFTEPFSKGGELLVLSKVVQLNSKKISFNGMTVP